MMSTVSDYYHRLLTRSLWAQHKLICKQETAEQSWDTGCMPVEELSYIFYGKTWPPYQS